MPSVIQPKANPITDPLPVGTPHIIGCNDELLVEVGLSVEEPEDGDLKPLQPVGQGGGCAHLEPHSWAQIR